MDCRRTPRDGREFCRTLCAERGVAVRRCERGRRARRADQRRGRSANRPLRRPRAACARSRGCGRAARPSRRRPGRNTAAATAARCRPARARRDAAPRASTARLVAAAIARRATRSPRRLRRIARLRHIDDESNADARYRRNALRNAVVPALRDIAPGYPATLVRAAELQADAAALLDDLAALDARDAYDGATLDCALFARLDARRGANVLRWFLREQRLPAPVARAACRTSLRSCSATLPLRGSRSATPARSSVCTAADLSSSANRSNPIGRVAGADDVSMPHGALRSRHGSVSASPHATQRRDDGHDSQRRRGERLRLPGRTTRRNVADLLREAGVARWERQRFRGSTAVTRWRRWRPRPLRCRRSVRRGSPRRSPAGSPGNGRPARPSTAWTI